MKIIPVILCGGSGTRLWPLSRAGMPKQFLKLMGEHSLLQNTVLRTQKVAMTQNDNFVFVTLADSKDAIMTQMAELGEGYDSHILCEPSARNTAAAVALAAKYVEQNFGEDAHMWVLPADHHIADEISLMKALKETIISSQGNNLSTFGIVPTRPDTGYGYICYGDTIDNDAQARKVAEFVEKPNLETAQSYLDDGRYLWNSGMFVFKTSAILESFSCYAPGIFEDINHITRNGFNNINADEYAEIEDISFDYAIMERADNVSVVPCSIGWSDIGSWESLWDLKTKDDNGNVTEGHAFTQNSENCFVRAQDRLITCAGVKDIVIIDSGDSILVADKSQSGAIKSLVGQLKSYNRPEVKEPSTKVFAWGQVKIISSNDSYIVQETTVNPNQHIDKMTHADTAKSIVVVEGQAEIKNGSNIETLVAGQSISISPKTAHRITNKTNTPIRVIETKCEPDIYQSDIVPFPLQNDTAEVA